MEFAIDSGHIAGGDNGAPGFGETEGALAKGIRDAVAIYLQALRIPHTMPPYFYDTVERLKANPDASHKITIHINSAGPKSSGLLALKNEIGGKFAAELLADMAAFTGLKIIEIKYFYDNWVNGQQRYTREFDVAKIPLVLIEAGFISNQKEIPLIKNKYLMAKGIIQTMARMYYNTDKITWIKIGSLEYYDSKNKGKLLVAPMINNSRTMIGLADMAQLFGAKINWIPTTKTIQIIGKKTAILSIGSINAIVDNKCMKLNTIPAIFANRTMIGLADMAAIFGGVVFYTPETKEIIILRY